MKRHFFYTTLFFSIPFCLFPQESNQTLEAFSTEPSEISEDSSDSIPSINHIYTYIDSSIVEQRQVYTHQEIEKSNSENLTSFLQSTGMQILSYGPYGLDAKPSIRGFTDETVRVIIDGICVNNAQYGTFDWTSININDIERIEIVRGGFTEGISDEGSVGGAIYITTKKQTLGHHLTTDTFLKSYLNPSYPIDTISQNIGYSGQLSQNDFIKINAKATWAQNKYQYENYIGKNKTRQNSSVIDGNADVKYNHFFNNGNSLFFGESFYAGNKECPGSENSGNPGKQKDYDNRFSISLFNPEILKGLKLEQNFAWLSDNRFYDDTASSSTHYVNTFAYAAYSEYSRLNFFTQSAGLTFDFVHLDSTDDGIHTQFSGTLKETSIFKLGSIFNISIPIAVKICNKSFQFIPKIGIKMNSKFIDLSMNAYRMIQFPNMDDLYWDSNGYQGNPDLNPEDGIGAEISTDIHNIFFPFSFCIYSNYYRNKIQWTSSNGKWQPENVASAFYLGFNLSTKKSLFNDLLVFTGNAEYLYTELLDESNSLTYKKRIMWTPDFIYSLSFTLNLKWISLSLEDYYTGKRFTSNLNINYLEPYTLINANITFNFLEKIIPYIRIDNILDKHYVSVENYPMPGISATFGVKTRLLDRN